MDVQAVVPDSHLQALHEAVFVVVEGEAASAAHLVAEAPQTSALTQ